MGDDSDLQHGDLAMVMPPDGQEPALARFNSHYPDDPDTDYWSFFGTDFTWCRDRVRIIQRVKVVPQ
ncbi:hypothetical protein [Micromonospora sp. NPDC049240]|uniref:hypothetical protein n=1 Tax=Micromonospora sp. NPDC049240 TaxID=3155151 RepID=UPI0033D487E7